MIELFQGVGGGFAEAFGHGRVIVDHVPEILGPGAQLDGQGGEMDDLRRILAGDVGADEAAGRGVEDELEEAGDVRVETGADEVVVAALADDVRPAAGLGFWARLC